TMVLASASVAAPESAVVVAVSAVTPVSAIGVASGPASDAVVGQASSRGRSPVGNFALIASRRSGHVLASTVPAGHANTPAMLLNPRSGWTVTPPSHERPSA